MISSIPFSRFSHTMLRNKSYFQCPLSCPNNFRDVYTYQWILQVVPFVMYGADFFSFILISLLIEQTILVDFNGYLISPVSYPRYRLKGQFFYCVTWLRKRLRFQ